MEIQRLRLAKVISKTKAVVPILPDSKIHYKAKVIKSVSFGKILSSNGQMVKRD